MAQHDGEKWPREEWPQADTWEDIQTEEPLDSARPESLWQLMFDLLGQLLEHHPMLFWSGIWVTTLLAAGIAVTGLMAPELSTRKPLDSPVKEKAEAVRASASSVEEAVSPFWLFGAIAISCGVGSLLLSQRFKQHLSDPPLSDDFKAVHPLPAPSLPVEVQSMSALALQAAMNQPEGDRRTPLGLQSQPSVPFLPGITAPDSTTTGTEQGLPFDGPYSSQAVPSQAPGLEELITIQQRRKGREVVS